MNDVKIEALLKSVTAGLRTAQILEHLTALGLIDYTRCEQLAMRREVDRRVRGGAGRCEAMLSTADLFSCSYAKVRQAVYYKSKF